MTTGSGASNVKTASRKSDITLRSMFSSPESSQQRAYALARSASDYRYAPLRSVASASSPELYSFSLSAPTAPNLVSTFEVGANVEHILYDSGSGTIFYLTDDTSSDFQVLDGSNLAALPVPPPLSRLNIANSPQMFAYDSTLDRICIASSNNSEELEILKPN